MAEWAFLQRPTSLQELQYPVVLIDGMWVLQVGPSSFAARGIDSATIAARFDKYAEGGEIISDRITPVQSADIGIRQFNAQTLKSLVKRSAMQADAQRQASHCSIPGTPPS